MAEQISRRILRLKVMGSAPFPVVGVLSGATEYGHLC